MARPKKPEAENREVVARFRLTVSEKSRFWEEAKSNGLTPSDHFRSMAFKAKPLRNVPTLDRELLLKILAELNMNGSNLNQIARALNRRSDSEELQNVTAPAMERAFYCLVATTDALIKALQQ